MKLYSQLSKIGFLKNRYVAKSLLVAFLGIHIPLIGLVFFGVYFEHQLSPMHVFLITLVLTLVATGITLVILKNLIAPVLLGSTALRDYKNNRTVPRLPLDYTDEAGLMLQDIQSTIQMNQKLLAEKKELLHLLTHDLRIMTEESVQLVASIGTETNKEVVNQHISKAITTLNYQINYVDAFSELIEQEAVINAEQVKIRKVNFDNFMRELQRIYKTTAAAKNIKLKSSILVQEARLKVNDTLLEKAFRYLLDYVLKYAPEDSKIELTFEKRNGRVLIFVKAEGIGFQSGQADAIFKKFNIVHDNNVAQTPEIGLYLVRQIIDRFGGTIVAESAGNTEGTTFSIDLKLYR